MKKFGIAFLLALGCSAGSAFAAGLAISEQGAAAMGLSAAVTARSQDLSAIYYNPAGLEYVQKGEVFLGLTPIRPNHKFETTGISNETVSKTYLPPQAFIAYRVHPRLVLGMGMYTPYGLGTDWDQNWVGRYTSTYAEVQSLYFNPSASVKVTDWLSLGGGFSFVYSTAVIEKMLDSGLATYSQTKNAGAIASTSYDSKFRLDGEGGGTNWNLGLMLRPSQSTQVGVSYRAITDMKYTGDAVFTHQDVLASSLSGIMPSLQDGKTTLHLPSVLSAGVLYNINERWDASFDVNFTKWSVYDKLEIDLDRQLPKAQIVQVKDWDNTQTYRFGTSFDLNPLTVLRGGLMYDMSPVPEETFDAQLPDGDRIGVSVGFGRKVGLFTLDFSYLFLKFSSQDKKNFVGYSDVTGAFPTTTPSPDGTVNLADEQMLAAMRGGAAYPVGTGEYKSYVNMLSLSASMKF